ncbi:MAG: hypothetical protein FD126_217 [Elusimicrobia bacterium]|nr:MAG: hypothetical protein FD126_217 [Elusimicrobiota bacterium]
MAAALLLAGAGGVSAQGFLEAARAGAAAPPIEGAVAVRTFSHQDVPIDFTSSDLAGLLILGAGRSVELTASDGSKMALKSGPVTLKYGKPTAWSFLTRDRSVSLRVAQGTAAFPARNSAFEGFGNFVTEASEDQPITLKGTQNRIVLKEIERRASQSCNFAGFCNRSAMNSKGEMSYGYGYSSTCTGTEPILERVRDIRTDIRIELLLRGSDEIAGTIVGDPKFNVERRTLKVTGSCS